MSSPISLGRRRGLTAAIAFAGSMVMLALGIPLPFLFGPMFACLFAALAGVSMAGLGAVGPVARTVLGVAIGASITPAVAAELPRMAASVALMLPYLALIALVGVPFFHRVAKYDFVTSWYAAMPGGLQDMVLFGSEAGGNLRALSLVHATRVLIIVTLAPLVLTHGFDATLTGDIGSPALEIPPVEIILMILAAGFGWYGGVKVGLFGASILGPMILTAVLSLTGLIHDRPPAEAIILAQFVLGIGIGVGYAGITWPEIRRVVSVGAAYVALILLLALGATYVVVRLGLGQPLETFLAFAPGGQGELTVLAIAAGADLGFIIVHHTTRLVLVISCAPIAARYVGRFLTRNN